MNSNTKFTGLIVLLLLANIQLSLLSHGRAISLRQDFSRFPSAIASWSGEDAGKLTQGEAKVLRADDYLLRTYSGAEGQRVGLFIAYYQSQKSGDTMHSPRNCLPGNGWEVSKSEVIQIPSKNPLFTQFPVNHLILVKDGMQQEIMYWYQANSRVFASEYAGKFYLVRDALEKNRTDGAIVRLSSVSGAGSKQTRDQMISFATDLSAVLPEYLPN